MALAITYKFEGPGEIFIIKAAVVKAMSISVEGMVLPLSVYSSMVAIVRQANQLLLGDIPEKRSNSST